MFSVKMFSVALNKKLIKDKSLTCIKLSIVFPMGRFLMLNMINCTVVCISLELNVFPLVIREFIFSFSCGEEGD